MSQNIIPTEIPVTLDLIRSLTTLAQQAIVRPNNPPVGIAGFLFDIELDEKIELVSDITDHFVEDNTSVQDHIALRPEMVTLRGVVAELVGTDQLPGPYVPPANPLPSNLPLAPRRTPGSISNQLNAAIGNAISAGTSSALAGGNIGQAIRGSVRSNASNILSSTKYNILQAAQASVRTLLIPANILAVTAGGPQAPDVQTAINVLKRAVPDQFNTLIGAVKAVTTPNNQRILTGSQSFSTYTSPGAPTTLYSAYSNKAPTPPRTTRQTSAFLYFYNLWKSRSIFSVETPWGTWTNMAIATLRTDQNEETKYQSEFTVTFKKIRVAQDVSVTVGQLSGRNVAQSTTATPSQRGIVSQAPVTPEKYQSILRSYFGP